jgi:diguanylate cyclase (GGDEF)-like protein/PAS domain S-box-containing protein
MQSASPSDEDEASRHRLESLVLHAPVALAMFDCQMRYLAVSNRWLEDYSLGAQDVLGRSHYEVLPEIPERWREVYQRAIAGETVRSEEDRFMRLDGRIQWLRWEARPWRAQDGSIGGIVIYSEDVSQERQDRLSLLVFGKAYRNSIDSILITDRDNRIVSVNPAFTRSTGYELEDVLGKNPKVLSAGMTPPEVYRDLWGSLTRQDSWQGELWDKGKDGRVYPKWISISVVRNDQGALTHYIASFRDLTEMKAATEQISRLAYYDVLTGLANRQLFADRLKHAIAADARTGGHGAILFLDLDNFKTINDTLGHEQGDIVLKEAAQRIQGVVREADTVARFGGDEFVVLLTGLGPAREPAAVAAKTVAEHLLASMNRPFHLKGRPYTCPASIGISLWRGSVDRDPLDLLKNADLAMYEAKKAGRNTVRFFEVAMQLAMEARSQVELRLRTAIDLDQFTLHFQRRVAEGGAVTGAEALIRWQDPDDGLLPPSRFISIAEESSLIVPIGSWVVRAACAHLRRWSDLDATRRLSLSVNISARQFVDSGFVEEVGAILAHTGADPSLLEFEITESVLLQDVEEAIAKMLALRALGISFALDDFGTGYSSLSYLQRLPIHILKIDRSFVHDLTGSRHAQALVRTIIQMGDAIGLQVIAEGVETAQQRDILREMGCRSFQGYLFGRPLPLVDFEASLSGAAAPAA